MLHKHSGQGNQNKGIEFGIHTIFVDDIPESMDPKGLYAVFSNFGVVRDMFIPKKRRKMTRSRFGFVWYDCPVAAKMAVQKAHGLWCDNRALKVKVADFGKGNAVKQRSGVAKIGRRNVGSSNEALGMAQERKTYAQVVSGRGLLANPRPTINAFEVGNDWLYNSAIVRLKPVCCVA